MRPLPRGVDSAAVLLGRSETGPKGPAGGTEGIFPKLAPLILPLPQGGEGVQGIGSAFPISNVKVDTDFRRLREAFGAPLSADISVEVRAPLGVRSFAVLSAKESAPAEPPTHRGAVRLILAGTGAYKVGMEAVEIALPLLVLEAYKSVAWVGALLTVSGLSQALSSASIGSTLERRAPQRVMSLGLAAQGAAIAGLSACLYAGAFHPAFVLPLYAAACAAQGVVETARRVLPRTVLGAGGDLESLNSKTHIVYEGAGIAGALLTGAIIAAYGLKAAIVVHPFAYALAAVLISRISTSPSSAEIPNVPSPDGRGQGEGSPFQAGPSSLRAALSSWLRTQREAAAKLWSEPLLRWTFVAILIPQVIHRVLENMLFPIYAQRVLHAPARHAWLLGSSNFGELLGAGAVLAMGRLASRYRGPLGDFVRARAARDLRRPFSWLGALGLASLGLWMFALNPPWGWLLPFVSLQSLVWTASDVKLNSFLQSREDVTPRELGFLFASYVSVITVLSVGLGLTFDALGPRGGILAILAAITLATSGLAFKARSLALLAGAERPHPAVSTSPVDTHGH